MNLFKYCANIIFGSSFAILTILLIVAFATMLPFAIYSLFNGGQLLGSIVLQLPDPRITFIVSIVLALASKSFIFLWHPLKNEQKNIEKTFEFIIARVLIAYLLAVYLSRSFGIFSSHTNLSTIILFIMLFIVIPSFHTNIHSCIKLVQMCMIHIKNAYSKKNVKEFKLMIMALILIGVIGLALISLTTLVKGRVMTAFKNIELGVEIQNITPTISSIQPSIGYQGTKFVLYGKHFGEYSKSSSSLKIDGIKYKPVMWSSSKMIFELPLTFKPHASSVIIEKSFNHKGEVLTLSSKPFSILVISRTDGWDAEDDAYFQQIRKANKEVLELNGYE